MDWTILGIEPTKDKKTITAAYRAKVVHVNPEDKPEEFKMLRGAYEEALRLAAMPDAESVRDESPVGLWMDRVKTLYADFPSRICVECWAELLQEDVCVALDKRGQAEEALLRFLMQDYFIPRKVWILLDQTFDWLSRREELYETFPQDFIDYAVINGIQREQNLSCELFQPGLNGNDCDAYRRLYNRANQSPPEEIEALLEQMDALSEYHPYGQAMHYHLMLMRGQREEAAAGYRELAEQYPDDVLMLMNYAGVCKELGDWDAVMELTARVLEINPTHQNGKRLRAEALAACGNYEDAKELIYELMRAAGGDQMELFLLSQLLKKWNEDVVATWEQTYLEHPEDAKNAIELVWCYMQNERMADALRVGKAIDPNYEDSFAYYNVMGKLYYNTGDYEAAEDCFARVEEILRGMQNEESAESKKRLSRLPEFIQLSGHCCLALKRKEEAYARYEQVLEIAPDNADILTNIAKIYASEKDHMMAIPLFERVTELMPMAYHGHFLLANSLFELGADGEAYHAVNRALELQGSDLWVYVLKMRILLRNGGWDEVREILEFLEQCGLGDILAIRWCRAQLVEFGDDDHEGAMVMYREIAERIEAGEYLEWAAKIYYLLAVDLVQQLEMNVQADRDAVMELVEKGLKYDPEDPNCLEYKARLLKESGQTIRARELFHELERYSHHPMSVEHNLAELYYHELKRHADKALHYYFYLLERQESADWRFYAGTCLRYMQQYECAAEQYLMEQELEPDDLDAYNGLAYAYEAMGRLEDALEQMDKAIEISKRREGTFIFPYRHKAQILRRMQRPREALATMDAVMDRYDHPEGYEMKVDICLQFGLWNEAKQVLDEWTAATGNTGEVVRNRVLWLLLQDKGLEARLEFLKNRKFMTQTDALAVHRILAEYNCEHKTVANCWDTRLNDDNYDVSHVQLKLAETLWFDGDRETARGYADQALAKVDLHLQQFLVDRLMYQTRRVELLAILGREEEARAELERVRTMPQCAGCDYCRCKDADVYEAAMEEILGNHEKAAELYRKYNAMWPDEPDFVSGMKRAKRKDKFL